MLYTEHFGYWVGVWSEQVWKQEDELGGSCSSLDKKMMFLLTVRGSGNKDT